MTDGVPAFLAQTLIVSLSGVLAPGPMTAVTLQLGGRSRHAGAWIAIGHGVVELPLMGLIMLGIGELLQAQAFQVGVSLAGGLALLVMGVMLLRSLRGVQGGSDSATLRRGAPVLSGIIMTAGNPYFLVWWATVGLALCTQAAAWGVAVFAMFALTHWLCDLAWLEALSQCSFRGVALLGPGAWKAVTILCAVTMAGFGAWYLWQGSARL